MLHAAVAVDRPNFKSAVGGGVRDVYAAMYEEAAQQILDEYYSRDGGGSPVEFWPEVIVEEAHIPAGRSAASTREQVTAAHI